MAEENDVPILSRLRAPVGATRKRLRVGRGVGSGLGKSKDIQFAIQKGAAAARRSMIKFPIVRDTIPHETVGSYGAGQVWMKPAAPGTGVIAGSGNRAVLEAAGIKNILTKSLGSNNHFSMVYAALVALESLRSKDAVMKLRGKA
jgi:small subunit ribosomal protein S5